MHSGPERHDVERLIRQLLGSARAVDKNDLVGLARMHGWCEAIASLTGPDGEQADARLHEQVNALAPLPDKVILGETENPDAAVAPIVRRVRATGHPDGGKRGMASAKADLTNLTQEEVAGRIEAAFAEEPGARKGPAEPSSVIPRAPEVQGETPVRRPAERLESSSSVARGTR